MFFTFCLNAFKFAIGHHTKKGMGETPTPSA